MKLNKVRSLMKIKIISLFLLIILMIGTLNAKDSKTKVTSIIKNSAAAGMGWEAGKQVTKEAIKKGKEVANSPKTKEKVKKLKAKSQELLDQAKEKIK